MVPIKNSQKVCNNNIATNKRQDGYNPKYNFDYIYRCLIQNVKFITKHAVLDLCVDETSWEPESYSGVGDGLTGQIFNKTGIMKISQTVLVSDVHRIMYRAYRHRHKLHVNHPGCNFWRNIEVKEIMEVINLMVEREEGDKRKYYVNTHTQHGNITSVGIR